MVIAGAVTDPDAAAPAVWMNMVGGDYFRALGIPLLAGRVFDERDRGEAPRVAVVNEAAARRYWPDGTPLGERIQLSVGWGGEDDFAEIVGVVGDVKLGGVTEPVQPGVYLAYRQFSYRSNYLVVQADGDPGALTGAVRAVIRELDPTLSAWDVRSMKQWIGDSTARTRFSGTLLLAFGAIALVLAAVGIYGVIAFAVAGRTREIGVRMAVGARGGDVMRLLYKEGLRFTAVGLVVGLGGTVLLTRFLRSELYEVSPGDPVTIVAVLALLTGAATVAILVPARRATRIDPMEALRTD
jgi:putative ABC transport system permease protein